MSCDTKSLKPGDILAYDSIPENRYLFEVVGRAWEYTDHFKLHYIRVIQTDKHVLGTIGVFGRSFIEAFCTKISK